MKPAMLLICALLSTPARADRGSAPVGPVEIVIPKRSPFDYTEGLAISRRGDMYVGYLLSGDVLQVSRRGESRVLASLQPGGKGYMTGLAVDEDDNVYAALWAFADAARNGVWRITPEGEVSLYSLFPPETIPNFIVLDGRGGLLVTDSTGAVWSVPRGGGDAELWVADGLLVAPPPGFFGANGAVLRDDELFVVTFDTGRIVKIPVRRDGSAAAPGLYLEDPALIGADAVTFDVRGNLYVVNAYQSKLLRVKPSKEIETLVTFPDNLPFAVNVEFGVGRESRTAYLTIDGVADVVKVDIGIRGLPRED
jgi:sugar lactone lactonase YvrE